jgi:hypothetical protein
MSRTTRLALLALALPLFASPAFAQDGANGSAPRATDTAKPAEKEKESSILATLPRIEIQNLRPSDKRGLNMFEAPKNDGVPYTGFKLNWGAAFTQQFQNLEHSNTAAERIVNNVNANQLVGLGAGFNNATANLNLNAQLYRGIRVSMTTYLSSRHHPETWVKDGYALIDASPIDHALLHKLMEYVTVRAGHFEINYGDAHFRRTDNGNAMFNPFVGNYIMDAFTTEVGGEVYLRHNGWLAMGGVTGGEIKGQVTRPNDRGFAYLGKLGYDKQLNDDLRVRLTGSMYTTDKSVNNTLYSGDRAGSRYYSIMENTTATEAAQAWSGAIQPGFRSKVNAYVINPFVKYQGLEFFGNYEQATGRAANETADRTWNQVVGEGLYRFLQDESLYLGARYNYATGRLQNMNADVSVNRWQVGGGWYVTPLLLTKLEYVVQKYNDFPALDIRNGAKFKGLMIEGVVAF